MIIEAILLVVIIVALLVYNANSAPKNYPPGPFKLPIVGNILDLKKMDEGGLAPIFLNLSKKYGPIFSFDFGSYRAVIINDSKHIKEAFANPAFCGRPHFEGSAIRTGGERRGILFHDGQEYIEQRRFALRSLKDFGMGQRSMESLILDEVEELIAGFKKDVGKPISTQNRFNAAVLNSLWVITTGQRFSHDDPDLMEVLNSIQRGLASSGGRNPSLFMPWLIHLLPEVTGWNALKKIIPETYNYLAPLVDKILSSYDGNSPENFAHKFIDQIKSTEDKSSSFYGKRGEKTLTAVLLDLFQAGAETTSTTLTWLFLYMSVFPEWQEKLHEEIDLVLEKNRPSIQDRYNMPYTESVILETLRYSSMVPTSLFHRAIEDIPNFKGFSIPKDTMIIANLYAAHFDPTIWENPQVFNPERFLSPDRKSVIKTDALMPFSTGKRVCLGETLARDSLFLFVTSIFQQFGVSVNPEEPNPTLQKSAGAIVSPKPHTVILTERKSK